MKKANVGELIEVIRLSPEGRELLAAIDSECAYGKTVFNPTNERQNIFNQGKQQVAVWLHAKHKKYKTEGNTDEK